MADTNYPRYEVGGQSYYRVNPEVPEWQEKAMTWAADKAARFLAPTIRADQEPGMATKAALYERTVLNRDPSMITERDMEPAVMQGAARATMRSMAEGRGQSIQRLHYEGPNEGGWHANPASEIFGRANYDRPATGGATIRDQFDFNNYEKGRGNTVPGLFSDPMQAPMWLGRRVLPDGTGPQVSAHIPQASMVQAKQDLYGKTAPAMLGTPVDPQTRVAPISSPLGMLPGIGLKGR